jgi:hypothetical protein
MKGHLMIKKTCSLAKKYSPTFEGNTSDENYNSRRGKKCVLSKKHLHKFLSSHFTLSTIFFATRLKF